MKNNILMSIIIPVYNSEKYIEELLKSLLQQISMKHEIILINDGSTDGTSEICNKYDRLYSNINVIYQENGGPAKARNKGLKNANGEYILFVDSDDCIKENTIKVIDSLIDNSKNDLIIFGYECEKYKNGIAKISKITHKNRECKIDEFKKDFCKYMDGWYLSLITNKIYRRNIIIKNNILFDETLKNSEDLLFNFSYIKFCEKISIVSNILYKYIKHNSESISSIYHNNLVEMQQYAFQKIEQIIKDMKADTSINNKLLQKQYTSINFSIIYNLCNGKYKLSKKQKHEVLKKIVEDEKFLLSLKNNSNESKVYKILFNLIKFKLNILINIFMKCMRIYNEKY